MNFALDYVKDMWAKQQLSKEDPHAHAEAVTLCCVIKAIVGWHVGEVATIARERCGGQGYLSCNRFGSYIGSSHASMTAEGDNSVLMQKVAKERLTAFKPRQPAKVDEDLTNDEYLHYLLDSRDMVRFSELAIKLMKAGKKGLFETWMLKESDLVQGAAFAFGELLVSERTKVTMETCPDNLKPMITELRRLFLLDAVQRDLGWFTANELISTSAAKQVCYVAESCRTIA
uniref:Acyl-CoA oxidase C-alpha1 domain-containing protein n=1 Tax=Ciona savignyi TaxID=51511 RepID=H2ZII3_CIOSA